MIDAANQVRYQFGVSDVDFTDSSLLLIGHGSTVNPHSQDSVHFQAELLERRKLFAQVLVAFYQQTPSISETLHQARHRHIWAVPFFTAEGYFTEQAIPRALGLPQNAETGAARHRRLDDRLLHYCRPVGTHPRLTAILVAKAEEVLRSHPFPRPPKEAETALILVGHGTGANPNSRRAVERQVETVRAQKRFGEVHGVFIEEEPRVPECYRLAQAANLVVVPFFLSDGLHAAEDIPILLGGAAVSREQARSGKAVWRNPTERQGKRVWYSSGVGSDPQLVEVVLDRVREAANESEAEFNQLKQHSS